MCCDKHAVQILLSVVQYLRQQPKLHSMYVHQLLLHCCVIVSADIVLEYCTGTDTCIRLSSQHFLHSETVINHVVISLTAKLCLLSIF